MNSLDLAYGFGACDFWLDAAVGLDTDVDLAAISLWIDKVGRVRANQGTAGNKPRLKVAHPSFNNNPTVQFFDANRYMLMEYAMDFMNGIDTFVYVANYDTLQSANNAFGSTAGTSHVWLAGLDGAISGVGGNTGTIYNVATESTSPKIVITTKDNIVVNGTGYSVSNFQMSRAINIIANAVGIGTPLIGNIAEAFRLNQKLSLANMLALSGTLNTKYALY